MKEPLWDKGEIWKLIGEPQKEQIKESKEGLPSAHPGTLVPPKRVT